METETKTLKAICSLIVDCPHSTPLWTDSGFVVLRNQNIKNGKLDLSNPSYTNEEHFTARNRRAKPSAGDIVITREAPMGEVCMIPAGLECCLGQRQVLLRLNPAIAEPRYVLYALKSESVQRQIGWNEGAGSTVSNLRIPVLEALNIPTPPIDEQRAIAHILGALDDKIDLNRRRNETLEGMARALFKSWFVDFDGVIESELVESELGLIPKGWRVGALAEVLSVQIGGAWGEESESPKSTVRVSCLRGIDAVEIEAGRMPKVPIRWVSPKQVASRVLTEGDILVEGSGSFCGRSLYWNDAYSALTPETPMYSNFVKRLASPQGKEAAYWASLHLAGIYRSGEISNYRTGSAFPNLDVDGLLAQKVAIPPSRDLWQKLYAVAGPMLEMRAHNILATAHVASLRDTLLPRLISGQLRIGQ